MIRFATGAFVNEGRKIHIYPQPKTLLTENEAEIVAAWKSENDNRVSALVAKLGYTRHQIHGAINKHLANKTTK